MAEIDLERRDLRNGLPHLCMLCGTTPAQPDTPMTLGPVPLALKVFAPLSNALHPSRVWLKAPLCSPCQAGYRQHNLLTWCALLGTLGGIGLGAGGLATGASWLGSLGSLLLGLLIPVVYLGWTMGAGQTYHLHCSRIDNERLTVRVPNFEFPKKYLSLQRGESEETKASSKGGSQPPPMIVENPEVVEAPSQPTCPFLRGEELARIPEELSPFLAAVKEGEFDKIARLLKAGASWEERTPEGLSAIHIATLVGASDIVSELVALGQKLDSPYGYGLAPIFLAVQCNYTQLLGLMLARKISPNCTNDDGQTPLHWACASADLRLIGPNRYKIVKQLLAAGADMSLRDKQGRTPGDLATAMNHGEALEALGLKEEARIDEDGAPDQSLFRPVAFRPED